MAFEYHPIWRSSLFTSSRRCVYTFFAACVCFFFAVFIWTNITRRQTHDTGFQRLLLPRHRAVNRRRFGRLLVSAVGNKMAHFGNERTPLLRHSSAGHWDFRARDLVQSLRPWAVSDLQKSTMRWRHLFHQISLPRRYNTEFLKIACDSSKFVLSS